MLRNLIARILAPLNRWVLSKIRSEHSVHGFRVVLDNARPDIESSKVLIRFSEALDLLRRYEPWRYARMKREVQMFWIVRYPVRGSYDPRCRMIITELTFLARTDIGPATVAASIVYQAISARLAHLPLRAESRDAARLKRVCLRAVLGFGRALPADDGAPVVEYAEALLALPKEDLVFPVDWKEANRRQWAVDRAALREWRRGAA